MADWGARLFTIGVVTLLGVGSGYHIFAPVFNPDHPDYMGPPVHKEKAGANDDAGDELASARAESRQAE